MRLRFFRKKEVFLGLSYQAGDVQVPCQAPGQELETGNLFNLLLTDVQSIVVCSFLFFLRSMIRSLVFVVLRLRSLSFHHVDSVWTSTLLAVSLLLDIRHTMAVLSVNLIEVLELWVEMQS